MAIRIGSINSIGATENLNFIPDDRQSLVKIIGGVVVEDYGVVDNGEVISLTATFSNDDYETLLRYWKNRTLVTVILDDGTPVLNARIVVRNVTYWNTIIAQYKRVTLEVWRI